MKRLCPILGIYVAVMAGLATPSFPAEPRPAWDRMPL